MVRPCLGDVVERQGSRFGPCNVEEEARLRNCVDSDDGGSVVVEAHGSK